MQISQTKINIFESENEIPKSPIWLFIDGNGIFF